MIGDASDFGPQDTYLSRIWDSLVGKSQAWYTNVSNLQDRLVVILAGVNEVGVEIWSMVFGTAVASGVAMDPFDFVKAGINDALKGVIVTDHGIPSDSDISLARSAADAYQGQLSYVKSVVPEIARRVEGYQADIQSRLPAPMRSPSEVGRKVFVETVKERAKDLTSDLSTTLIVLLGLAALGLGLSR